MLLSLGHNIHHMNGLCHSTHSTDTPFMIVLSFLFTKNVGVLVNLWRIMFNLPASFFDGLSKVFKSKFYKCIVTFYKCIVTIRLPVSRWLRKQEMQPFIFLFFVYCNQVWNMKLVLEEKKVPSLLFHFQEGLCFESSSTNAVDFASKISKPLMNTMVCK